MELLIAASLESELDHSCTMELLAAFAFIALCPLGVFVLPRMRPVQILLAVTVTGVVFGRYFFSVGPVSLDRLVLVGGLAAIVANVMRGTQNSPRLHKMDIAVAGFTIWMCINSFLGTPPEGDPHPLNRWLFFVFLPSATYALARFASVRPEDAKHFKYAIVGLGIYLAVTGVFEVLKLTPLVFPRYIMDPVHWEFLGRARGPLLNPIGNGIYLTTVLAIGVYLWWYGKPNERLMTSLLMGLLSLTILLTLTRSVWIGALLLVPVMLYLLRKQVLIPIGLFAIGGAALLVAVGPSVDLLAIKRDENLTAADAANSVKLRPILASIALDMFWDRPLVGHGYGCYLEASKPYVASRNQELPLEIGRGYVQHNTYLAVLVDAGIIGLTLFVVILALTARMAWQLSQRGDHRRIIGFAALGCLCSYFVNALFHDIGLIPLTNTLMLLLSGLVVTSTQELKNIAPFSSLGRRAADRARAILKSRRVAPGASLSSVASSAKPGEA
ncbi:MAG: O-antigen ligase family protein [Aureliella sp.]